MARLSFRQRQRKVSLAKWSKVDWSKQDCVLADELRVNAETIRQVRQQLAAPKPTHPKRRRKTTRALQWGKDNLDKLKGFSGAELQRKYGLKDSWRHPPLYWFLKPFLRNTIHATKHPWGRMDFHLPNGDLARIWRVPYSQVASHRSENRRSRPRWRRKPESAGIIFRRQRQLLAYLRAMKAEEKKAARYFAQVAEAARAAKQEPLASPLRGYLSD
jgi:hypothetical protein